MVDTMHTRRPPACCQVAPPGGVDVFCATPCSDLLICLYCSEWWRHCVFVNRSGIFHAPLPLPVCFGLVPVPPWLRGFILGCCGGVWRLYSALPIGRGRERPYVIHIVWLGWLAAGDQTGNPIAALLSSLDTAGGTTSGQTVQPITGPLQLSLTLHLSSALHFSRVTYLFSLYWENLIDEHDSFRKSSGNWM